MKLGNLIFIICVYLCRSRIVLYETIMNVCDYCRRLAASLVRWQVALETDTYAGSYNSGDSETSM